MQRLCMLTEHAGGWQANVTCLVGDLSSPRPGVQQAHQRAAARLGYQLCLSGCQPGTLSPAGLQLP